MQERLNDFYAEHKEAVIGTGVLLALVYIFLLLTILIIAPFLLGQHQTEQKLQNKEQTNSDIFLSDKVELYLKGKETPIVGSVIMRSEKMITIFNQEMLVTYPMSEVHSFKHKVIQQQKATN